MIFPKFFVGIDYSITSPAFCIYENVDEEWNSTNCTFHFFWKGMKDYSAPILMDLYNEVTFYAHAPIRKYDVEMFKFASLASWVLALLPQDYSSTKIMIEGYAMGAKGRVFNIAENTGVLKSGLYRGGYEYETAPPKTIKKFATGNGNADKSKMEEAWMEEVGIDLRSIYRQSKSNDSPSSDIIDSYFIAKYNYMILKGGKNNDENS